MMRLGKDIGEEMLNGTAMNEIVPSPKISIFESFSQDDFERAGGEVNGIPASAISNTTARIRRNMDTQFSV
jgi:hypothetical protein